MVRSLCTAYHFGMALFGNTSTSRKTERPTIRGSMANPNWKIYSRIYWNAFMRLVKRGYISQAASISFSTLLTIVPFLSVLLSVSTVFPIFSKLNRFAQDYILTNFIPDLGNKILKKLTLFTSQAEAVPTWGIISLLLTLFILSVAIQDALSGMWKEKRPKKRVQAKILKWFIMTFSPVFIGLSVLLSAKVFSTPWFEKDSVMMFAFQFLSRSGFPFLLNILVFTVLYWAVPRNLILWKEAFLGACTSAVLFELAKKSFAFYIRHVNNFEIYGAMAVIPIFLVWVFISWLIVLYGSLVMHAFHEQHLFES